MTTTVYSCDYYSQLQKRQDEASKQPLYHNAETDAIVSAVEANVNGFQASRQLEHITTSSSVAQKVNQFVNLKKKKNLRIRGVCITSESSESTQYLVIT